MCFNKLSDWIIKSVCGEFWSAAHICISKHKMCDLWWLSHEMTMYFNIYIYIHTCIMIMIDMDFHVTIMLRSTTGPYGRPVIKVAYGEMILSLHRGCVRDDSSGRVVQVSAWRIAHVWHTRVNTSVGSMYYFLVFYI